MSFEGALTFFITIFIFCITPGPGVFAMLARAMLYGPRKCFMLAMGMVISDLIYLIAACFGLSTLAENYAELFVIIRYLGAAYLIYIGYKMFKALPHVKEVMGAEGMHFEHKKEPIFVSFFQGFLISASNPKVILFYVSFLPTFIDLSLLQAQDMALAALLSCIALMSGLMLIAFWASRMAKILKTPLALKRLNQSAGGIMIAAGSYLVINK